MQREEVSIIGADEIFKLYSRFLDEFVGDLSRGTAPGSRTPFYPESAGSMISGKTLMPAFLHSMPASMMARTCIIENFRVGDAKAASAVAEHWVGFMKLLDSASHDVRADAKLLRQFLLLLALVRHELMQRWIDQSDGYRKAVHGLEDSDEVAALERQKLI